MNFQTTQYGAYQIAVQETREGRFTAWAKIGIIEGPNALFEPGDPVYFEFGCTADQARERLLASLPKQ